MKKIIVLLVFFLCGCSKKLVCTYKVDYEDIKINNKIEFNLKDNTYKEIDKMIFEDEDEALEYFEDIEEYVEDYNLRLEDNVIISEIEDAYSTDKTKKDLKEQYEGYDYKCR